MDFHRCTNLKGPDYEPCNYFKRVFTTMCPIDWVEKWDDQRAEGSFPTKL